MDFPGLSEDLLRVNLEALRLRSPALAERLCAPMGSTHIQLKRAASGAPTAHWIPQGEVLLHSEDDPVREAEEATEHLALTSGRPLLCVGLGLGYYLWALSRKANPCQPILAYERDPWLLRLALMRVDFARDILSGRLRFLLGTELFETLSEAAPALVWCPQEFKRIYALELEFIRRAQQTDRQDRRALMVEGGLLLADVAASLRHQDFQVLTWAPQALSLQESRYQIQHFNPHLVLSINLCRGLPELCESLGIPYIVWEIDSTIEKLPPQANPFPRTRLYTYRKSRVSAYKEAGFRHVEHLPLATNPRRYRPIDLSQEQFDRYGADIAFVGSSLVGQAQELRELFKRLICRFTPARPAPPCGPERRGSSPGGLSAGLVVPGPGDPIAQIIQDLGNTLVVMDENGRLVDLALCVAEAIASQRRIQLLNDLAVRLCARTVKVWGDEGWSPHLHPPAQYCGAAGYLNETVLIYNAARINLDIDRAYQKDIITTRVFDAMACGGFVLAAASDDLDQLFTPGADVITYHNASELHTLADHFLRSEQERHQIARAGYERVTREHTVDRRVRHMLEGLG